MCAEERGTIAVRRREALTFLGGAALAWPASAWSRIAALPVVGFLHTGAAGPFAFEAAAFREGLAAEGFEEKQNVSIEYRWAEGRPDRLPGLAAELVDRKVAVIAAIGGDVAALAAKAATSTIPIVFLNGSDPIKAGLVTSTNRPGGNITGVSLFAGTVDAKRLELLHELAPRASVVAVLNNGLVAETDARSRALTDAARTLGLRLLFLNVNDDGDFDAVSSAISSRHAEALFVSGSAFFLNHREKLIGLADRHRLPAIYAWRALATAGGLMSYGTNIPASDRAAGAYVGRILKGDRAADLPVLQPTTFDLVINARAARALGIAVPPMLLAAADEVIE